MVSFAVWRLAQEREAWRKNHPYGFYARPVKNSDGSLNLMVWECAVPGRIGKTWVGERYKVQMLFDDDYPYTPPRCKFDPPLRHPCLDPCGTIRLSMLVPSKGWRPTTTVKDILFAIEELLGKHNIIVQPKRTSNGIAYRLLKRERKRRVRRAEASNESDTK